jgi:hypothetical protein
MKIFVFESALQPRIQAITLDASGATLPESVRLQWRARSGGKIATAKLPPGVADALRQDGYAMMLASEPVVSLQAAE